MLATITLTRPRRGAALVTLAGELDLAALGELCAALEATRGCADVVVEASGVDFIDCCALHPVMLAARTAARAGGRLHLHEPSPPLVRLVAWCHLEEVLPTCAPQHHEREAGAR